MSDLLQTAYAEIAAAQTQEQYQETTEYYVQLMEEAGLVKAAQEIKKISAVQKNRFSRQATLENFEKSREKLLHFLKSREAERSIFSQDEAVKIVARILEQFHNYCCCLYKKELHQKCSDPLKEHLPQLSIKNEYDLQRFMYPLFRAVFEDACIEEVGDSGHHTVRKDIVIKSYDIAIELKCSRPSMTEQKLSEEIAADIIHYENKYIFFYVYDRTNIIKNVTNFKKTYENKIIFDKKIVVNVLQINNI